MQMELASALGAVKDQQRGSKAPKLHLLCSHFPLRTAEKREEGALPLLSRMQIIAAVARGHDAAVERDTALAFLEAVLLLD